MRPAWPSAATLLQFAPEHRCEALSFRIIGQRPPKALHRFDLGRPLSGNYLSHQFRSNSGKTSDLLWSDQNALHLNSPLRFLSPMVT